MKNNIILIVTILTLFSNILLINSTSYPEDFNNNPTSENFQKLKNPSLEQFNQLKNPSITDFEKLDISKQQEYLTNVNIEKYPEFAKKYLDKLNDFSSSQNKNIAKQYLTKQIPLTTKDKIILTNYLKNGLNIPVDFTNSNFPENLNINQDLTLSTDKASINLNNFQNNNQYTITIDDLGRIIINEKGTKNIILEKGSIIKTDNYIETSNDAIIESNGLLMSGIIKIKNDNIYDIQGYIEQIPISGTNIKAYLDPVSGLEVTSSDISYFGGLSFKSQENIPIIYTGFNTDKRLVIGSGSILEKIDENYNQQFSIAGEIQINDLNILKGNPLKICNIHDLILNKHIIHPQETAFIEINGFSKDYIKKYENKITIDIDEKDKGSLNRFIIQGEQISIRTDKGVYIKNTKEGQATLFQKIDSKYYIESTNADIVINDVDFYIKEGEISQSTKRLIDISSFVTLKGIVPNSNIINHAIIENNNNYIVKSSHVTQKDNEYFNILQIKKGTNELFQNNIYNQLTTETISNDFLQTIAQTKNIAETIDRYQLRDKYQVLNNIKEQIKQSEKEVKTLETQQREKEKIIKTIDSQILQLKQETSSTQNPEIIITQITKLEEQKTNFESELKKISEQIDQKGLNSLIQQKDELESFIKEKLDSTSNDKDPVQQKEDNSNPIEQPIQTNQEIKPNTEPLEKSAKEEIQEKTEEIPKPKEETTDPETKQQKEEPIQDQNFLTQGIKTKLKELEIPESMISITTPVTIDNQNNILTAGTRTVDLNGIKENLQSITITPDQITITTTDPTLKTQSTLTTTGSIIKDSVNNIVINGDIKISQISQEFSNFIVEKGSTITFSEKSNTYYISQINENMKVKMQNSLDPIKEIQSHTKENNIILSSNGVYASSEKGLKISLNDISVQIGSNTKKGSAYISQKEINLNGITNLYIKSQGKETEIAKSTSKGLFRNIITDNSVISSLEKIATNIGYWSNNNGQFYRYELNTYNKANALNQEELESISTSIAKNILSSAMSDNTLKTELKQLESTITQSNINQETKDIIIQLVQKINNNQIQQITTHQAKSYLEFFLDNDNSQIIEDEKIKNHISTIRDILNDPKYYATAINTLTQEKSNIHISMNEFATIAKQLKIEIPAIYQKIANSNIYITQTTTGQTYFNIISDNKINVPIKTNFLTITGTITNDLAGAITISNNNQISISFPKDSIIGKSLGFSKSLQEIIINNELDYKLY